MKKGSKMTPESREKMSISQKKRDKNSFPLKKGYRWSPEILEKLRESHRGKKQSAATIEKRVAKLRGENNPRWGGGKIECSCFVCGKAYEKWPSQYGKTCSVECYKSIPRITPLNKQIRHSKEYKLWRTHVFNRDDYTCQACGERGGNLQADHELPFSLFPDLRFEILNGRTLCVECHENTPTYKGKLFGYKEALGLHPNWI